jgi:hypothetical protein
MEIVQKYRRETGQRGSKVLNLSIWRDYKYLSLPHECNV